MWPMFMQVLAIPLPSTRLAKDTFMVGDIQNTTIKYKRDILLIFIMLPDTALLFHFSIYIY